MDGLCLLGGAIFLEDYSFCSEEWSRTRRWPQTKMWTSSGMRREKSPCLIRRECADAAYAYDQLNTIRSIRGNTEKIPRGMSSILSSSGGRRGFWNLKGLTPAGLEASAPGFGRRAADPSRAFTWPDHADTKRGCPRSSIFSYSATAPGFSKLKLTKTAKMQLSLMTLTS